MVSDSTRMENPKRKTTTQDESAELGSSETKDSASIETTDERTQKLGSGRKHDSATTNDERQKGEQNAELGLSGTRGFWWSAR